MDGVGRGTISIGSDVVAKTLHPSRRQTTVSDILRGPQFRQHFAASQPASGIKIGMQVLRGNLHNRAGVLVFSVAECARVLRNGQMLLVNFAMGGMEYYAQTRVTNVFNDRCELGAVPGRFYDRVPLSCAANIWLVPNASVEAMTAGTSAVKRAYGGHDAARMIDYFSQDYFTASAMPDWLAMQAGWQKSLGTLMDLSQGGAHLVLPWRGPWHSHMLYMECALNFGRGDKNLGVFIVGQAVTVANEQASVRGSFFLPLPTFASGLRAAAPVFTLDFGEPVKVTVNGAFFNAEPTAQIAMPFGPQQLRVLWRNGDTTQHTIVLEPAMARTIRVTRTSERASA